MIGGEAVGSVWRWIKTHKAATALIVVLLTLVPVLPEYKIVDFAGRDEEGIRKLLCSKLPDDGCHRGPCSDAVQEQTRFRLARWHPEKRPLIPGVFLRHKEAYVFDYALWREAYTRQYAVHRWARSEVSKG